MWYARFVHLVLPRSSLSLLTLMVTLVGGVLLALASRPAQGLDQTLPNDVKLDQWETAPSGGWITGALQKNNSDYEEGEAVPFQLTLPASVPVGDYEFQVCREYRPGAASDVRGYLFLEPFDTDRAAAPNAAITSSLGAFRAANASLTDVDEDAGPQAGHCGANEWGTVVRFSKGEGEAYILWGGHLAAPSDIDPATGSQVGSGNSASFFSGGSLHMRLGTPDKSVGIQPGAIIPVGEVITINAYKVVCTPEESLPDWGAGAGPATITDTTAMDYVNEHHRLCWPVDGWEFEWGAEPVDNPGDNLGSTVLNDFATTTSDSYDPEIGTSSQTPATVRIDISQYDQIWVREKLQDGYFGFTGAGGGDVSAEFYCSADIQNYDNWERIEDTSGLHDLTPGATYNCVGFNVENIAGVWIDKRIWDGDSWDASYSADFRFDIIPLDAGGTTYINVPSSFYRSIVPPGDGFYYVAPGNYRVVEHDPVGLGYELYNIRQEGGLVNWCQDGPEPLNSNAFVDFDVVIGERTEICVYNRPPAVLGTGTLVVRKFEDLDGLPGAGDDGIDWTVTVTGPEFPGGQQFELGSDGELALPGIESGSYTVRESSVESWVQTGLRVNSTNVATSDTADVAVLDDGTTTVEFYNQPRGTIVVEKTTLASGVAVNERGGWDITVTGCGVIRTGTTSAIGRASFSGLPACPAGYTVRENPASRPGYTATSGDTRTGVGVVAGQTTTVGFVNSRVSTPTPTATPTSTPTGMPQTATATPQTPSATATSTSTFTPVPTETTAGEITPGILPTPIAPPTGTGAAPGGPGIVGLLMLMLVAIGGSAAWVAFGKRS